MHTELIKKLSGLNLSKSKIETDLGMPKNSLSGMLLGSKGIPNKWVMPLTDYADNILEPINESVGLTKKICVVQPPPEEKFGITEVAVEAG